MADNIVEKLNSLLGEKGAGEISKRIANNEKSIAALLKKIGEIQAESVPRKRRGRRQKQKRRA